MATPRRLSRPPIREALVDLRIDPDATEVSAATFDTLRQQMADMYPSTEVRNAFRTDLLARVGAAPQTVSEDLGFEAFLLKTADESRIAQFRKNGFTLNQVGGYTSADDLFDEALRLWGNYVELARPKRVVRIALRYINQLALPFRHGDEFTRFLNAPAALPGDAHVSEFLIRAVTVVNEHDKLSAIVSQRLKTAVGNEGSPFVLDIDVFRAGEFAVEMGTLRAVFDQIRQIKNDFFFALLTDEALEPYR